MLLPFFVGVDIMGKILPGGVIVASTKREILPVIRRPYWCRVRYAGSKKRQCQHCKMAVNDTVGTPTGLVGTVINFDSLGLIIGVLRVHRVQHTHR